MLTSYLRIFLVKKDLKLLPMSDGTVSLGLICAFLALSGLALAGLVPFKKVIPGLDGLDFGTI